MQLMCAEALTQCMEFIRKYMGSGVSGTSSKRRRDVREWFKASYDRLQDIDRNKFPQKPIIIDNATPAEMCLEDINGFQEKKRRRVEV